MIICRNVPREHVAHVPGIYHEWRSEEGLSAVVRNEELARNDFNLSPSRGVATNDKEEVLPLEEAGFLLKQAEQERAATAAELNRVLESLVLGAVGR